MNDQLITTNTKTTHRRQPKARRRAADNARSTHGELRWLSLSSTEGRTDLGNAERFVDKHGESFRYCFPRKKWLAWDGKRWAIDQSGRVMRAAKATVNSMWHASWAEGKGDVVRQFVSRSSNKKSLEAMVGLATSERGIPVMPDDLDRHPWLLNCANGTVDLRTGERRPHTPADMLSVLCPTAYQPNADCPTWEGFLHGVLQTKDLVDFMQRMMGYCLTGDVREQLLLIFYGCGSNGKTTFLNGFMDALGPDFSMQAARGLLLAKRADAHPTELADLFGKRFVVCAETDDGKRLAEATVKQLTGGDRIRARRMKEDFWEFTPTHKVVLCTNHKPEVQGTDHAIWRRLALVPFGVQFWNPDRGETGPDELRQDKTLSKKLRAEREGILAWAVRGCLEWQANGLQVPHEVRAATDHYRRDQDTIAAFLSEQCLKDTQCSVQSTSLYNSYATWAERSGEFKLSQKKFGGQMTERGFDRYQNNGVWYRGIALREPGDGKGKSDDH